MRLIHSTIKDTQLYPSFDVCSGNTHTIVSECRWSNWISMGISSRLTDMAPNIKQVLCNAVDNELNNK